MSTSVTGLPSALRQLLYVPPKYFRAITPASRRLATRSCVSCERSGTCDRHAVHAQGGGVRSEAENEIVRGRKLAIHVLEIAGDRDFADGVGELAIFDPEASGAARIVAGHTVHAHADH